MTNEDAKRTLDQRLTEALQVILDVRKAMSAVRTTQGGFDLFVSALDHGEVEFWDTEPFEGVLMFAKFAEAFDGAAVKEVVAAADVRGSVHEGDALEVLAEFQRLRELRAREKFVEAAAEVLAKPLLPEDYPAEHLFQKPDVLAILTQAASKTRDALEALGFGDDAYVDSYFVYRCSAPGQRTLEIVDDDPRGAISQYMGATRSPIQDVSIEAIEVKT